MYKNYYLRRLEKKELVNQVNDEDVLIYNVRRVIPLCIPLNVFNQIVLSQPPEDSNLLIELYHTMMIDQKGCAEKMAVLTTACYSIPADEFEKTIADNSLSAADQEILLKNYHKTNDNYLLNRNYDDILDVRIARIFKKEFNYSMFDDYYVKLSNIFEKIDFLEKTNIFRGGLFVNTIHKYFYRKDYEHIPGMMLIEASRQFGYSVSYHFLGVQLNEIIFALTNLNIKFHEFAQSNFPVYIQARYDSDDFEFKKLNRTLGYNISFYQRDQEVCTIDIYAKTIANRIFQRVRKGSESEYCYRFVPGLKFQNVGYFINVNDQKKCKGNIKEVSLTGFIIKFESDLNLFKDDYYQFIIYIENVGIIHGVAVLLEKRIDFDHTVDGEFRIDYIDPEDKESLKESIKKYTFLLNEAIKE